MKTVSHTPVPTVFIKSKFWRQLWELVSGILSSVLCPSVSLTTNCQVEKDEVIHRDWVRLILSRLWCGETELHFWPKTFSECEICGAAGLVCHTLLCNDRDISNIRK